MSLHACIATVRECLTGDTVWAMDSSVSVRDLRNRGGAVIDAVARGGAVTITRDGVPVAELRPLPLTPLSARELIRRRKALPAVDPSALRADIDAVLDAGL